MLTKKVVVGIDPGQDTGIAVYSSDGWESLGTFTPLTSIYKLESLYNEYGNNLIVALECVHCDSTLYVPDQVYKQQKNYFGGTPAQKHKKAINTLNKRAINTGMVISNSKLIAEFCELKSVRIVNIKASARINVSSGKLSKFLKSNLSPNTLKGLNYPSKLNNEQFRIITGFDLRNKTNEHERDAGILAYQVFNKIIRK